METAVLARLFEQRSGTGGGQVDLQEVEDATFDELDPRFVDRFREEGGGDDLTTVLAKLDVVREDAAGVLRATVAGLLLGTRQPQRWRPHAFIQSVAYRGVSVSDATGLPRYQLDAKDNDGPSDDQVEYACRFVARTR